MSSDLALVLRAVLATELVVATLREILPLLGPAAPQMLAFENRIPAPLSSPAQAPVVNGPMSPGPQQIAGGIHRDAQVTLPGPAVVPDLAFKQAPDFGAMRGRLESRPLSC